ncbi:MAG: holo-ACP synthase [Burkholderiales bacterium]|nr:holo-ACP synthase [Burkholderiales bacterium]
MAIHGIGTDIVAVSRIRRAMERHDGRFARKVLSASEWSRLASQPDPGAFVAKRFAAKEAFYKALGQPPSAANTWHQLSIASDQGGAPRLEFGAALAALLDRVGVGRWHVSLSDERDYAVAFIVLESEGA